jgi:hypothetical protein
MSVAGTPRKWSDSTVEAVAREPIVCRTGYFPSSKVMEKEAILNSPPKPAKPGPSGGQFVLLAVLVAILIVTVVWATTVWTSSNDVPMSKHGWIALGLGTLFSLVIGCGLMALMFFSSRSGHDEVATLKFIKRPVDTTQND